MMNVNQLKAKIDSNNVRKDMAIEKSGKNIKRYLAIIDTSLQSKLTYNKKAVAYKEHFIETIPDSLRNTVLDYTEVNLRSSKSYIFNAVSEVVFNTQKQTKLNIEFNRKFSLAFACLVLFFIGAPLGAIIRKGGIGMPVVVGVLFFVVYFIMSSTGEKLAKEGELSPFMGMWGPGLILVPIAVIIVTKASNDSPIFSKETYTRIWNKVKDFYNKKRHLNNESQ